MSESRRPRPSAALFHALVEYSFDAIALLAEDGSVLYVGESLTQVLGWTPADREGRPGLELIHEDDREMFRQRFADSVASPGVPVRAEFRMRHKDGSWRMVEWLGVNRLADPIVRGIIVNYHDVTERRRAEEALRDIELRYRYLVDHASDIIYNTDANGCFTFFSRRGATLLEYRRVRAARQALPEADPARLPRPHGRVLRRSAGAADSEHLLRVPGGRQRRHGNLARPERAARHRARGDRRRAGHRPRHHEAEAGGGSAAAVGGPVPVTHPGGGVRHLPVDGRRPAARREPGAGDDARLRVDRRAAVTEPGAGHLSRPRRARPADVAARGRRDDDRRGGRLAAPGRHADPGAPQRPRGADRRGRPVLRRDRRGRHRAPGARGTVAAGAEDGGHRPAGARHRARLQQHSRGHRGIRATCWSPACRPTTRRARMRRRSRTPPSGAPPSPGSCWRSAGSSRCPGACSISPPPCATCSPPCGGSPAAGSRCN